MHSQSFRYNSKNVREAMRRIKRRIGMLLLLGAVIWSCNRDPRGELLVINPSYLPHEGSEHKKTWLSFYEDERKQDNILIATAIAQYEPVSIIVGKYEHTELRTLLGDLNTHHYPIEIFTSETANLWIRDKGPTFVLNEKGQKSGIDFSHNNVDETQEDNKSTTMAEFIITKTSANIIHSNLTLDAGCFEVDGSGTAMMIESCIMKNDHNQDWDKEEIEKELKVLLGLQKIIWLKNIKYTKNTNAHIDFYARFVKKGLVLVHRDNDKESETYEISRENIKILQKAKDAQKNPLQIVIVDAPKSVDHFSKSYLGYYLCNNALLMQTFGDEKADYHAEKILQSVFPDRTIETMEIDMLSSVGGNIHRMTQQELID